MALSGCRVAAGAMPSQSTSNAGEAMPNVPDSNSHIETPFPNWANPYRTAVGEGEWVYFYSNKGEKGLYKMRHNGSGRQLLYRTELCNSISVSSGWVYFVSGKIYRIKTDGTCLTALTDDAGLSIQVAKDRIYYQSVDNGTEIMRMGLDGTGKATTGIEGVDYYAVEDQDIFYTDHVSADIGQERSAKPKPRNLHRQNLVSGREETIGEGYIPFFAISGGKIFYAHHDGTMREYGIDSGVDKAVFENANNAPKAQYPFCVVGDGVLYYVGNELFRMDAGSGDTKRIAGDFAYFDDDGKYFETQFIDIVGEWIYYYAENNYHTYRVHIDGSKKERI
jgi:hypothetical protein